MEAFSSTFHSKYHQYPTTFVSRIHSLNVLSVRIEEREQEKVVTTTRIRSQPQRKLGNCTIKMIKKREKLSLFTNLFNLIDDLIANFLDCPLRPSIDPTHVLTGNFAPVDELPPTECELIQGCLPRCLDGAYIRNGPNPQFIPSGPYHLFDGDGMLHSVRTSRGKATFCSRYVKTYKYMVESKTGSPVFLNLFSAFNGLPASLARCAVTAARVLTGQFNPSNGVGLANTSLALLGGNLFALGESDLPYAVKVTPDGDIITLGRHNPFGKPFMSMTAHPKIDPETGETFAFRYSGILPPYLSFFRIDANGIKQQEVPIFSMTQSSFVHDFAITKNYVIFPEAQIRMNLMEIFKGRPPMGVDPAKVPRLGFIPRYAKDESDMWWIDLPGFNIVHMVNAWEENDGNTIVVVAPNISSVEHVLERLDLIHTTLEKISIDIKTKTVSRLPLSTKNLDFGVINWAYVGKKNKYMYAAVGAPMPKIAGVVKVDLSLSTEEGVNCVVASQLYDAGCYGGEPFFVPREHDNPEAEEDDGYVVTYVHDENTEESRFLVMDAKSPTLGIVATVKLPCRVPYGFHGLFVHERDLNKL